MQELKRNNFNQPKIKQNKTQTNVAISQIEERCRNRPIQEVWSMLGVTRSKIERKRQESFNQCNHSNGSRELNETKQGMNLTAKQKAQTSTGGSAY